MMHRVMLLAMVVSTAGVMPIPECGSEPGPIEGGVELRLAKSSDGITFDGQGRTLLAGARSPALVCLPNGRLAALFTYGAGIRPWGNVTLVSFSSDEGASWSEPEVVRVTSARGRPMTARGGALARGPAGQVRLYFVGWSEGLTARQPAGTQPTTSSASEAVVFAAVTKDGVDYRVESVTPLPIDSGAGVHLAAAASDKQVDLYVSVTARTEPQGQVRQAVLRFVSRDGRRFSPAEIQASGSGAVGSVVPIEREGWRAYLTVADGIRSVVSKDGAVWKEQEGLRMSGGSDPAVVRLKDGTYLMLYCAKSDAASRELGPAASQPSMGAMTGTGSENTHPGEPAAVVVDGKAESVGRNEGAYPSHEGGGPGQETDEAAGSADTSNESIEQIIEDPMPPQPDFVNPVDYLSWMKEQFPPDVENNAYDAYGALLPYYAVSPTGEPDTEPAWWPKSFNDAFYADKPGPWLPDEHPDWEATHQLLQWPLSAFRDATLLPNYAMPYTFGEHAAANPDQHPLIWELLLPGLASCRTMAKATLANGWRVENGRVDPDRMTEGWATCLRNAAHMAKGSSTIQQLVGVAEQNLVHDNARLALKRGVFQTADEMQRALDVLKQHDRGGMKVPTWMLFEATAAMETTQYLFTPASPDGQPQINVERIKRILPGLGGPQMTQEDLDRFARMGPEDAYKTADAIEQWYRETANIWRVGYPQKRAADMKAIEQQAAQTTEITKMFMPSLGRVYEMAARNETSRRATRLTYEVHLFKARNGRWPASLEELPLPPGDKTRTDPFSGGDFGYRQTEAGPTIYSLSENGRDDGGVHSPRWADGVKSETDSDDYVFWPPQ